ncbi:MAG: CRISPR system precrRNA processing endoribonuclease RAMP protein Cas6 [Blautia sp.]|nr:CRISPR system precrRNA processing endoribonuclease RAMP protein Cas6 [Blautia sp.]
MEDYKKIRYTRLTFVIEFEEETELVREKVSAIRGGIGEMLLRANCIANRQCESCGFRDECIVQRTMYSRFEKLPESVHAGDSVGYTLCCTDRRKEFAAGDRLEFTLTLFGRTIVYFSQYLNAVYALGQNGLGSHGSRFRVLSVRNLYGQPVLEGRNVYMERYRWETLGEYVAHRRTKLLQACEQTEPGNREPFAGSLVFETPLCLKYQGQFQQSFTGEALSAGVLRRLWILSCFENVIGEEGGGYRLFQPPEQPALTVASGWARQKEISRYSSRHGQNIMLKGIVGKAELTDISEKWLDLLLAGEVTQIGKNTSFGFGKYHLEW